MPIFDNCYRMAASYDSSFIQIHQPPHHWHARQPPHQAHIYPGSQQLQREQAHLPQQGHIPVHPAHTSIPVQIQPGLQVGYSPQTAGGYLALNTAIEGMHLSPVGAGIGVGTGVSRHLISGVTQSGSSLSFQEQPVLYPPAQPMFATANSIQQARELGKQMDQMSGAPFATSARENVYNDQLRRTEEDTPLPKR